VSALGAQKIETAAFLWHIYIIVVLMVGFSALQGPALMAAVSQLVPRHQLGRAVLLSSLNSRLR